MIGRTTDLRAHVRGRGGHGRRRRVLRRRGRGDQPEREDLPVQDGRGRRGRHVVDRVGEPRRAHAVRPARRARPRQRRHHPRGRGAPRHGLRHRAAEGLDRHDEPRHQPHRARAEARAHRRAQPRPASTSRTSSWPPCRSPGSRCATAGRRAASPCGSRPATPTPSRSASSTPTAATSTPAMQRKIERLLYREDYRRAFAGDIGDIVFPPRSLEFYTAALERMRRHRPGARAGVQGRARLLVRRGVDRDAEPARQARRRGARGEPVREHRRRPRRPPRCATRRWPRLAELVRASGSDLGFVIDPDGETRQSIVDDTGHVLEPEERCSRSCSLVERGGARRAASRCRSTSPARSSGSLGEPARWSRTRSCRAPSLMEAAAARTSTFAGTPDGGCIWPDFLPAYDAAVTLVKLLDLLAAVDRPLSTVVRGAARGPRRARDDRHAVGAQGHGDARDRRAGRRRARSSSSTA